MGGMFRGASHFIFERAKYLRNHLTPSELIFWGILRENFRSAHFRRQHPISNYIADFYSHKLKLIIEIDGNIHDLDDVQKNDKERQEYLESIGLTIVRFSNRQIKNEVEFCIEYLNRFINSQPPI